MNTPLLRPVLTVFVSLCLTQTVARADDIVSIKADQPSYVYTSSGSDVDFKITLVGTFVLTNTYGGTMALPPELRMIVNGSMGFATLYSLSQYQIAGSIDRTDVIFRYRIKPGDMAQPLRIYGSPDVPYQFMLNGWEIRNAATQSNAVWRFAPWYSLPSQGEVYDLDLSKANITLRTLSFDDPHSPSSIQATIAETWRVTTVNPAESAVIDCYVWTPQTNIVQLGAAPNQPAVLVSIPSGSAFLDVPIRGLSVGTAEVYLQRPGDYQKNATAGVTNYIRRTVTVTDPPPPNVRIIFSETGTDAATMSETNALNTGRFRVALSEPFTNAVSVRVDLAPSDQTSVAFASTPLTVTIPPNQTLSSEQAFSVPDGNVTSMWGVTMSPVVTRADAAAYYTDLKGATVYVQNVKPSVTGWSLPHATRGVPCDFEWLASDVAADLASGMKVTWNFNGETVTNVTGVTGSLLYTFATTGLKTVRVTATDKDGLTSDPNICFVEVHEPPPPPSIRVVPSETVYSETTTNNTGSLVVTLSEPYSGDVWVQVAATLQGQAQSNIVLSTDGAIRIPFGYTNSPVIAFSIPDGTLYSEIYGINLVPTVTNAPASAFYTDLRQTTVFVRNEAPSVAKPVSSDPLLTPLPQYTNVTLGRPFVFDYTVEDVPRDQNSMVVRWDFGDGTPAVLVTGAVGSVSHTYGSLGVKTVTVQAGDKDGGYSDEIAFPVSVVVPPPPPTVSVIPPGAPLAETASPNTAQLTVRLSEAFTNAVTVDLAVSPATNAVNGAIILAANRVVFAIGQTEKTVSFSARDGTDASGFGGFTVTPLVTGNAAAKATFTTRVPGVVTIMNVAPVVIYPMASNLSGDPLYSVPQGQPWTFYWSVSDVSADLSALSCTWTFGDGTSQTVTGASGSLSHTFAIAGEMIVRLVVWDKDGGSSEVAFKIRVVKADGFAEWAAKRGMSGDPYVLFELDRNGDGVANGFEYAFGGNLTNGVPLMTLRFIDGLPVVETPNRDPASTFDAFVTVEACTNLLSGGWAVPMGPCAHADKPADRDWYAPLTTVPKDTFFRLRVDLD